MTDRPASGPLIYWTSAMQQAFGNLKFGDEFVFDGKLYRKRGSCSARLLRLASGKSPMMPLNRLIHPEIEVDVPGNDLAHADRRAE